MINWKDAKKPNTPTQRRVFASHEWDAKFRKINTKNLKPAFRTMFVSIQAQYRSRGWLTIKQARAVNVCWEIHNNKESQLRGLSTSSFRGLPGVVYEPEIF